MQQISKLWLTHIWNIQIAHVTVHALYLQKVQVTGLTSTITKIMKYIVTANQHPYINIKNKTPGSQQNKACH